MKRGAGLVLRRRQGLPAPPGAEPQLRAAAPLQSAAPLLRPATLALLLRHAALLLAAALLPVPALFPAAAQSATQAPSATSAAPGPAVVDDAGQTVRLAAPARRIVSLSPHATELLFAAGAGPQLVGVSRYSDYPAAAARLPQVGDSAQIDLERLAALHPDLVVAWDSALPERTRVALAGLNLAVFRSEPHTLDAIADTVEKLAVLAGRGDVGRRQAAQLRGRIDALRRAHAGLPLLPVFVQVWPAPLMTVNRAQAISDALAVCGARNLFAAAPVQVPTVDVEAVVAADPEAIISGVGSDPAAARATFARWRALPRLRAVARHHLLALDADQIARPGPRLIDAAEQLCQGLDRVRAGLPLAEPGSPVRP